jgi:hypothetical protein
MPDQPQIARHSKKQYYMKGGVHKLLIPSSEIIKSAILLIGQSSEDAEEV